VTKTKENPLIGQIRKRWEELIGVNPRLRQLAEFHQAVCARLYRQPPHLTELPLQPAALKNKLEQDRALLQGEEARLDLTPTIPLFYELIDLASTYRETLKGGSQRLPEGSFGISSRPSLLRKVLTGAKSALGRDSAQAQGPEVPRLLVQALLGDLDPIAREAMRLGISLELLLTLLQYSLMPALQSYARQLKPVLELDLWTRGYCPVCGAWPVLSELRGADPIRYLRCALCGSDWVYPLLRCPYCENADHKRLEYFFVEGEEKKERVYTCEECKGYMKVFSTLDPIQAELLTLEDLATLHLDMIASEKGYSRPYPFQKV